MGWVTWAKLWWFEMGFFMGHGPCRAVSIWTLCASQWRAGPHYTRHYSKWKSRGPQSWVPFLLVLPIWGRGEQRETAMGSSRGRSLVLFTLSTLLLVSIAGGFQSDELLQDDEEFGLEGGRPAADPALSTPTRPPIRRRPDPDLPSGSPDSKSVQFSLEHQFGGSGFFPAGTFTARLKSWSHGGQVVSGWSLLQKE